MMAASTIRYEQPEPAIARIVLARPEKRNAQDRDLLYALDDAYTRAVRDERVRVVILAADGPDFSAGHDLETDWAMGDARPRTLTGGFDAPGAEGWFATEEELFTGLCLRWRDLPRPTIAEVRGRVIGGGLMLVWPCDLVVAAESATFVDPVSAFDMNGMEYFTHLWELGARRAKEMLFTGEPIGARDALAMGMVNRVVADADLESATLELATRIAGRPPFGLRLAKRAVNHGLDLQGQRAAVEAAFGLHQLGHNHNLRLHGSIVDPEGRAVIRRNARRSHPDRRDNPTQEPR
ncbi:enoyl-CoA hydratase [Prauserella sp. PE36]|uniref:Enoyl-CoA hydratase n=2 Tax=Pseudonocardiaceae TaxID=2070 RepID=A0ABY2SAW7_9PSEU|nr:enoyl-CoA hydratase [Prauserella coralliicola]RBM17259.1 enoyl-CoA hydratase [Prauserella sp. PE36]TKG72616.1 enoyl-CoA hydratase [Prauserella endophytica]